MTISGPFWGCRTKGYLQIVRVTVQPVEKVGLTDNQEQNRENHGSGWAPLA
jgi:hypothetical protein